MAIEIGKETHVGDLIEHYERIIDSAQRILAQNSNMLNYEQKQKLMVMIKDAQQHIASLNK